MIKIKAWFSDWREVDKEKAKRFISYFMNSITTTSDINKKIALVEGKHLQGITVKELLNLN